MIAFSADSARAVTSISPTPHLRKEPALPPKSRSANETNMVRGSVVLRSPILAAPRITTNEIGIIV